MYSIVVLFVLCCHTLSQPVTRELQAGECCPCPEPSHVTDAVAAGSERAASLLDDCPCRARGADSEGAASLFFPTAVRAGGPVLRPSDTKNLLEPEVDLASSMLDTLREATEEEYQDALARDAARSDAVPEESARNVVIIVNPRDTEPEDILPEATHVQESRCVHPLGRSLAKLRTSEPVNILPESLAFPKRTARLRNNLLGDSSLGASNLRGNVIDFNGDSQRFQPKPLPKFSSMLNNNVNDGDDEDIHDEMFSQLNKKADITEIGKLPQMRTLKLNNLFRKPFEDKSSKNVRPLFNDNAQELAEGTTNLANNLFRQSNLNPNSKNILKLRDFELIPKQTRNNKPLKDLITPKVFQKNQSGTSNMERANKLKTFEHKEDANSRDTEESPSMHDVNECIVKQKPQVVNQNVDNLQNVNGRSVHNPQLVSKPRENESILDSRDSNDFSIPEVENTFNNGNQNFENEDVMSVNDHVIKDLDTDNSNTIPSLLALESEEIDVTELPLQNHKNNVHDPACYNNENSDMSEDDTESQRTETQLDDTISGNKLNPIRKPLSDVNENLLRGIENLRKLSTNVTKLLMTHHEKLISDGKNEFFKDNLNTDSGNKRLDGFIPTTQPEDGKRQSSDISFDDLQDMSDKLLLANDRQSNLDNINDSTNGNLKSTNFEKEIDNSELDTTEECMLENVPSKQVENDPCMENTSLLETLKDQNNENQEMDTGASDNIITEILDPMKSNINVLRNSNIHNAEPSTNPSLKMFTEPLRDTKMSTKFPTLENVNKRKTDIETKEVSTEELSDVMRNTDNDDLSIEPMSPAASVANSRLTFPPLLPLDDVDIFRNNLPITTGAAKKTSRLHSDTFRSNLVPKDAELLTRTLGSARKLTNDGRLFDFGSDIARKPINLIESHFKTLPSLDDLSNTVRSNTQNLLNKPLNPDLNLFTDHLRSANLDDFSETIRQSTQQNIKDLQRKIKPYLRKAKTSSTLADQYAKPQELKDDMNDKLKAIHYDFNDRLATLREDILDSTRLRMDKPPHKPANRNVMTNFDPVKAKKSPARFQTASSTMSTQKIDPSNVEPRASNNLWQLPLHKKSEEKSSPLSMGLRPSLSQKEYTSRQNPPPIPTKERPLLFKSQADTLPNDNKEMLRKSVTPFEDYRRKANKVTISFGSTTPKPIPTVRSRIPTTSKSLKERLTGINDELNSVDPQLLSSKLNSFDPASLLSSHEESEIDLPFNNLRNLNLQRGMHEKDKLQNAFDRSVESTDKFSKVPTKLIKLQKPSDNSFLSKVMNAFSNDSDNNVDNNKIKPDMLRSESRDTNAIGAETLRENVSYRCRMVCTKD